MRVVFQHHFVERWPDDPGGSQWLIFAHTRTRTHTHTHTHAHIHTHTRTHTHTHTRRPHDSLTTAADQQLRLKFLFFPRAKKMQSLRLRSRNLTQGVDRRGDKCPGTRQFFGGPLGFKILKYYRHGLLFSLPLPDWLCFWGPALFCRGPWPDHIHTPSELRDLRRNMTTGRWTVPDIMTSQLLQ